VRAIKARRYTPNDAPLIVAQSGRMLAELAARAGRPAVIIDQYGDQDTRQWARAVVTVADFDLESLTAAVVDLSAHWTIKQVIYGSGLENHLESLIWLAQRFSVTGCSPEVIRALHDKPKFFNQLQNLGIDFPEVRFTPPCHAKGWLLKPYRGCGGEGVVWADALHAADPARDQYYWQRWQAGRALSLLAFADTTRTHVIGFHRLYHRALQHEAFRFTGLDNRVQLPRDVRMQWRDRAHHVAETFQLRGLFGIDFLWDGQNTWLLEINPRPPASLCAYEPRQASQWLAAHWGETPRPWLDSARRRWRHYQICYTYRAYRVPQSAKWPAWVNDQPSPGHDIPPCAPLCSFTATGRTPNHLKRNVQRRKAFIYNLMN